MGELVQLEIGSDVEGWRIDGKLGEGAFGAVYVCSKDNQKYALKVESVHEKVGFLKMELTVLSKLKEQDRLRHFCRIEDKGRHNDFFYIVMTMVGRSLQVYVFRNKSDCFKTELHLCLLLGAGLN
ncbi:unnamed protein product [Gongylonema pulchrum]|uniref:Protein kinase domain-containing protein n=1 Tax=Gongylonema pulchrum TaxID=637853 RepID=A0A183EQP9_9BILA|nr:unnamed protein product [Gongylonema pulchrum]